MKPIIKSFFLNNKIKYLSLFLFIVPTITIIISYIFSLYLNLVPSCIPPVDGCTSISRTGRYFPVNLFFKSSLFFSGILIFLYWFKNFHFFSNLNNRKLIHIAFFCGIVSILFLFMYLFFLGDHDYYKFFRKIGIFIYLLFSVISEFILALIYYKNLKIKSLFDRFYIKFKLFLNILLVSLGIILFPFMIMKIDNVAELRNIISWNYFFLIQLNFLFTFLIWKK
tara:strand:- start:1136 stop:1807 length:672 start_codon:yes stop_codon:yes gene_type:complete